MDDPVRAIGEPTRRAILRLVRDEERTAGEIGAQFPLSQPTISQHLRVLREAGLLHQRNDGNRRLYRARPEGLDEVRVFVEELWGSGLSRLKREAERQQPDGARS